jgi:hypothetical protein
LNELLADIIVPVVLPVPYSTCELLLPPFVPGGAYTPVSTWYAGNTGPDALAFTVTEAPALRLPSVAVTSIVARTGVISCAAVSASENAVVEDDSDDGEKTAVIPVGSAPTARLAVPDASVLSRLNSTTTCWPLIIVTLASAG